MDGGRNSDMPQFNDFEIDLDKFTSDRTIQEYVDDIWKLDKVVIPKEPVATDKKSITK